MIEDQAAGFQGGRNPWAGKLAVIVHNTTSFKRLRSSQGMADSDTTVNPNAGTCAVCNGPIPAFSPHHTATSPSGKFFAAHRNVKECVDSVIKHGVTD